MSRNIIVGAGEYLHKAERLAQDLGLVVERVELETQDQYNFDLTRLRQVAEPEACHVFVALDGRAINRARHKLISEVRLAGYPLMNLVSSAAHIEPDVRMMGNVHIGPGCSVSSSVDLGVGCWLDSQVSLGQGVSLAACVTLIAGVVLDRDAKVGRGSTIGPASFVPAGARVGRHCEWLLPGAVPVELPDGCFFDQLMPQGARIF